ncbi:replication-relaxation family protein [Streptomyces californicus]|uniref:replication-relaxation family protein n=1 Tax=Streptomyces californicus TaxID=67351 RepID=UPI0037A41412
MILTALGVVKVATAAQLRRLMAPGHATNQTILNGAKDLAAHGLVVSLGSAKSVNANGNRVTEKLWHLTPAGLEAAGVVLERDVRDMGSTAKASVASGAPHARKVTDTITAFIQPVPVPTKPVVRKNQPAPLPAAAPPLPPPLPPPGISTIDAWETEVVLPVGGSFVNPVKGSLRADAVLTAPEAGLPMLCVEVDNGTEDRPRLAAKLGKYVRFYQRTVHAPGRSEVPLWTTLYEKSDRGGYPPLAIVFTADVGAKAMRNRMTAVRDLTRHCWRGKWNGEDMYGGTSRDGYRDHSRALPVIVTTLARLQQHGPLGSIWWRYGHSDWETLKTALDNPDDFRAYRVRDEERRRTAEAERERKRLAYKEERRRLEAATWPCPTCGRKTYPGDGAEAPRGDCRVCLSIKEREHREAEERAEQEAAAKQAGFFGFLHGRKNE